jgi:hypothetical protein
MEIIFVIDGIFRNITVCVLIAQTRKSNFIVILVVDWTSFLFDIQQRTMWQYRVKERMLWQT